MGAVAWATPTVRSVASAAPGSPPPSTSTSSSSTSTSSTSTTSSTTTSSTSSTSSTTSTTEGPGIGPSSTVPTISVGGISESRSESRSGGRGALSMEDTGPGALARSGADVVDLLATGAAAVGAGVALSQAAKRRLQPDDT